MKTIELLQHVLDGGKVTRTSDNKFYCRLSGGKIIYSDLSEMSLETWLRLNLTDWIVYKEPITFKDLQLGTRFTFEGIPEVYQKARLDFGLTCLDVGVDKGQRYSLGTPDAKVRLV